MNKLEQVIAEYQAEPLWMRKISCCISFPLMIGENIGRAAQQGWAEFYRLSSDDWDLIKRLW